MGNEQSIPRMSMEMQQDIYVRNTCGTLEGLPRQRVQLPPLLTRGGGFCFMVQK